MVLNSMLFPYSKLSKRETRTHKVYFLGPGYVMKLVECLPNMSEALGSTPSTI